MGLPTYAVDDSSCTTWPIISPAVFADQLAGTVHFDHTELSKSTSQNQRATREVFMRFACSPTRRVVIDANIFKLLSSE